MGLLYHTSLVVEDLARAAQFYDELLATIGGKRVVDQPPLAIAYARDGEGPSFWLQSPRQFAFLKIASHCHFAFAVETEGEAMAFHDKALELGAELVYDSRTQNDIPGYLGFVFKDLDGHLPEVFVLRR